MFINNVEKFPREEVKAGSKTTRQVLINSSEAPNFAMRKFTIQPGGDMPMHTNTVEHEQYVLGGSADVIIGDQKFIVKKNDVVFIPAGIPHCYKTIGDESFEFLCLIPNKEDLIKIL